MEKLRSTGLFGFGRIHEYAPVGSDGSSPEASEFPIVRRRGHSTVLLVFVALFTAIAGAGVGYYAAVVSQLRPVDDFLAPPGNIMGALIYNKTFTLAPSPETDKAWDDVFPTGRGFVKHPTIAPQLSGLAVFHQIHCVNILRVGYYAALDGNLEELMTEEDENKRPDPHHTRHCFDYLRQSLMCNSDTNLEPVDFSLGGVTGWKYERSCRNFEALKEWASEWHAWDPSLPTGGHEHHH